MFLICLRSQNYLRLKCKVFFNKRGCKGMERGGGGGHMSTGALETTSTLAIDNGWQLTVTLAKSQKATKTFTKNVLMISEF